MKKIRCGWSEGNELMSEYHDKEWGYPVHDDRQHFEFLVLEAAQAGLSWLTVLKRRKGYEKAFGNFDPKKVAKFGPEKIEKLIKDPSIIRNRLKIEAAVHNAKLFLQIQKEFGSFDNYCWQFVGGKPKINKRKSLKDLKPTSPESDAWSLDLKKRGFKFVGSTVLYAHMQAVGMINDHLTSFFRYKEFQASAKHHR
jgi:DNA-3-methyladenine glycosylase I